ncbi:MAG: AAA family ATPase [Thermodesulfobacteria bacterium]|nr:AAA family ATPase [Thermodesulfobacteriota bacterium]
MEDLKEQTAFEEAFLKFLRQKDFKFQMEPHFFSKANSAVVGITADTHDEFTIASAYLSSQSYFNYEFNLIEECDLKKLAQALVEENWNLKGSSISLMENKETWNYAVLEKNGRIMIIINKSSTRLKLITNKLLDEETIKFIKRFTNLATAAGEIKYTILHTEDSPAIMFEEASFYISREKLVADLDPELFELAGANLKRLSTYFESKESILFVFGAPGVGKSKLVAYILGKYGPEDVEVFLVKSLETMRSLCRHPVALFNPNRTSVFVFDDLDFSSELIRKNREEIADFVSLILSASDGVVPTRNKLIFTTNQLVEEIDPALLRPGRVFDVVHLKPIKRKDLPEKWKDKAQSEEVTIAELVFSKPQVEYKGKKIGF